jgi:hypothetical protein
MYHVATRPRGEFIRLAKADRTANSHIAALDDHKVQKTDLKSARRME